ncbi:MAG: rod shape-determining protein MreD [Gammaproteobacteria bacterium]|nr:rod shape-determining protein MreD [Gammaproteobacteria bacterium]MCY3941502.1 rod shape-determining protein MreD [Gammaproteobacteria bacterium]MCY3989323.1 rod shape-determining protein MreD [Gammaproteobacteria bacterium]
MTDGAVARNYALVGAALLISIVPLPRLLDLWQPPWLAVALIWLVLAAPENARLAVAAAAGLLQDLLVGSPLGLYALAATVLVFLAANMRPRIVSSPPWLRFLLAMLILAAYLGVVVLIGGWFGYVGSWAGIANSLMSGGVLILIAFLFLKV